MQINRLHLFVSQCITAKTVKVVKAKTTILQGARACARARNLDFTFVKVDEEVMGNDRDSRSPYYCRSNVNMGRF